MTFEILQGHILDLAPQLLKTRANSIHCIATSPPYYGLRDYATNPQVWDGDPNCVHDWQGFTKKGQSGGTKSAKVQIKGAANFQVVPDKEQAACTKCGAWRGELGQEPTPAAFVTHLVTIFTALKPLLHTSGTLWVNLGDSYASQGGGQVVQTRNPNRKGGSDSQNQGRSRVPPPGAKPKDLLGIPWTFALAMREAGWFLRADIIWAKRNPMPESVTDRPTKSHEYIFLFSKSEQYFFDHVAAREALSVDAKSLSRGLLAAGRNMRTVQWSADEQDFRRWLALQPEAAILLERYAADRGSTSVMDVTTVPYPGAHFAVWPPKLAQRMIQAGSSEKGVCPACWEPWRRVFEKGTPVLLAWGENGTRKYDDNLRHMRAADESSTLKHTVPLETTGWEPGCECHKLSAQTIEPIPATVLDPFSGSGTTLAVATKLGRDALGMELNPEYIALALHRLNQPPAEMEDEPSTSDLSDLPLFAGSLLP